MIAPGDAGSRTRRDRELRRRRAGSRLVAEIPSSNSWASSQRPLLPHIRRKTRCASAGHRADAPETQPLTSDRASGTPCQAQPCGRPRARGRSLWNPNRCGETPPKPGRGVGSSLDDHARWRSCESIAHCRVSRTWPRAQPSRRRRRRVCAAWRDDCLVLAQRLSRTAGAEDVPVTEIGCSGIERDQHLDRHLVVGDAPDPPVQLPG